MSARLLELEEWIQERHVEKLEEEVQRIVDEPLRGRLKHIVYSVPSLRTLTEYLNVGFMAVLT
jgi:hypothetical protein